jgi:Caspase domain/Sel1 repeat
MAELTLPAGYRRNFANRRRLMPRPAGVGFCALLATSMLGGCQTGDPAPPTLASGSTVRTSTSLAQTSDFAIVDCLLPGHVRRLGGLVYAGERRPVRTTGRDCAIRSGEYVLYDPANYATALKIWMPLAQQGDPTAQVYVGEIYERGLAGSPDYAEAANWYRQATSKGSSSAKVSLGHLYEKGLGVERDAQKALNLYREAVGLTGPLTMVAARDLQTSQQEAARERQKSGALQQQVRELSTDLTDAQQRLDRLQQEAEEKRQALAEAREQLARLPAAPAVHPKPPVRSEAAQDKSSISPADETRSRELAQRQGELERLQADLRRRERALADQADTLASRAADVSSKEAAVEKGKENLAEARQKLSSQQEALERARREIETQQATLARERERIAAERDRLREETAKGARIAEHQAEVDRRSALLTSREAELAKQAGALDRRAAEIEAREAEVRGREQTVADARASESEREALIRKQAEVEQERQRLAAELERVNQEVSALQKAGSKQDEVIAGLQVAAGERESVYAQLASQVDQYETELNQNKKEITALTQQIEIMGKQKTPPAQVAPGLFGNYHALIIGNDEYAAYGSPLSNARFDAQTVADVLRKKYRYKVTLLSNATRADILGALNVLKAQLTEMDNLLIYYAGHGQIDGGTGYWLPVDAEPAPQTNNWISNNDITNILKDMEAKHVLVVADSCYGGSLATASRPPLAPPDEKLRVDWIKTVANTPTRMVMTSGSLSPVLDGGGGQHSIFAMALLEVLGTNDDVMEGGRVYLAVAARVSDASKALGRKQNPAYRPLELEIFEKSDYFFVPS